MMKIGLIDVDGHNFPNLALMKISAYHKCRGDSVEWVNHFECYDRVYMSKVFTFSPDVTTVINAPEIIRGGTGYDIKSRLPDEIESIILPDYSLYPQYPFTIQFFSRGCIRSCPFCLVNDKEGYIHSVTPMGLNPCGRHIEVLDNNFFANPSWHEAVEWLKSTGQHVNLHGVDIRIMNEEQARALNSLRIKGNIHIAWDNAEIDYTEAIRSMTRFVNPNKIVCYVLVGFRSTVEQDLYRLRRLKELGVVPFVQPFRDYNNRRTPSAYERDLARWANKRQFFKSIDFADFRPRKGFRCSMYITP